MSIRTRLALVAAGAVAVTVAVASGVAYAVVGNELRDEFDQSLRARAAALHVQVIPGPSGCEIDLPPQELGTAAVAAQLIEPSGAVCRPRAPYPAARLPVSERDRELAARGGNGYFRDVTVGGTHVRILADVAYGRDGLPVGALQVARSMEEVDTALGRIRIFLLLIALAGVAAAVGLGLVVARAALAPVRRLTAAAEDVTATRDLTRRIEASGRDEVSRLASAFNAMLAALEDSARAQRRLVSDASHELRTPLTSLRTNIEVLARDDELAPADRDSLLRDVTEQLAEMTALVAELVELARGDEQPATLEDVRLDLVAADAIARAERNRPGVAFRRHLEETVVRGVPATIERAVSNLLDNAAKWSPPDGEVDVFVRSGEIVVRDRGPGIDAADAPFIFDRFYRAPSARAMPGSGLGLAIVRQVAEAHGGTIVAEAADGGGTQMRLRLPPINAVNGGGPRS